GSLLRGDLTLQLRMSGGDFISLDSFSTEPSTTAKNNKSLLLSSIIPPPTKATSRVKTLTRKTDLDSSSFWHQVNSKKLTNYWDMEAPEMTPEIRKEIKALQLRAYMAPDQFYKRGDLKDIGSKFQIGKVISGPA